MVVYPDQASKRRFRTAEVRSVRRPHTDGKFHILVRVPVHAEMNGNRSPGSGSLAVDGALVAVVLMWAATFTLFKVAWRDVDPVAFTALRFAAMVMFSLAVLGLARTRVRLERRDLPLVIASGLTGYFVYQISFVLGLDRTSARASAILISTHPIFSVVFVWFTGKERPRRVEVAGVLIAFGGVAVFLRAWAAFDSARVGDLLSLVAAAAFGAYGVITRPLVHRYPSRELMAYSLLAGGTLVAVAGIPAMVRQDWTAVSWPAWLILAYAMVGPVYVAYALWNWAISRQGIPRTVVYGFLVPVVAGAIAVLVLDESVRPEQVAGATLVVIGLVVTRRGSRPDPILSPDEVALAADPALQEADGR
jgi:drug/metabolite transporter (DMT)-like permease